MKTSFVRWPDLPVLAWCLELRARSRTAMLIHGGDVETRDRGFVEGAWDGDFGAMDPGRARFLAGSGGRIGDDTADLFAPSHTLEALYTVALRDRWLASNSLVFLLHTASLELDPYYRAYLLDLRTITRGLNRYQQEIPTRSGPAIRRHVFCNLRVSLAGDGDWRCEATPKPLPPRLDNYGDYVAYLRSTLSALLANAADPYRRRVCRPLATLSSGYDSTASAALVARLGCREAVTIRDASWGALQFDSGASVGPYLGLAVTEAGVRDYLQRPDMPEAEFAALGDAGDVQLCAFEDRLPGRVLVTGFHGDKMWDPHNAQAGPDVVRGDASGSSLAEFRYRVGFLHVPVPFIACQRHADIHRISNDPAMAPWRVGGDYDRPIPRRISEEAGVPRELFGQRKAATAVWWTRASPTDASRESYHAYQDTYPRPGFDPIVWIHHCAYAGSRVWARITSLVFRVTRRLGIAIRLPQIIPYRFTEPPAEAQLVQWGVATVRSRYSVAAAEEGVESAVPPPTCSDAPIRHYADANSTHRHT